MIYRKELVFVYLMVFCVYAKVKFFFLKKNLWDFHDWWDIASKVMLDIKGVVFISWKSSVQRLDLPAGAIEVVCLDTACCHRL